MYKFQNFSVHIDREESGQSAPAPDKTGHSITKLWAKILIHVPKIRVDLNALFGGKSRILQETGFRGERITWCTAEPRPKILVLALKIRAYHKLILETKRRALAAVGWSEIEFKVSSRPWCRPKSTSGLADAQTLMDQLNLCAKNSKTIWLNFEELKQYFIFGIAGCGAVWVI